MASQTIAQSKLEDLRSNGFDAIALSSRLKMRPGVKKAQVLEFKAFNTIQLRKSSWLQMREWSCTIPSFFSVWPYPQLGTGSVSTDALNIKNAP